MTHLARASGAARSLATLMLALAALAGCAAPPPVRTESAPGESVARRATFAWAESGFSWPDGAPPAVDAELERLVRDSVVAELARRGYAEDAAQPDFVVSFHATVRDMHEPELCMLRNRVVPGDPSREVEVCRVTSPGRLDRTYRKGTLVVFVVDRAHGVLLWQGVAEDSARSVSEARTRIRAAVERMFRDFPARAR